MRLSNISDQKFFTLGCDPEHDRWICCIKSNKNHGRKPMDFSRQKVCLLQALVEQHVPVGGHIFILLMTAICVMLHFRHCFQCEQELLISL